MVGLLFLIAGSYLILTLLDRFIGFLTIPPSLRGRITLSLIGRVQTLDHS
jgi:hypothetical protein